LSRITPRWAPTGSRFIRQANHGVHRRSHCYLLCISVPDWIHVGEFILDLHCCLESSSCQSSFAARQENNLTASAQTYLSGPSSAHPSARVQQYGTNQSTSTHPPWQEVRQFGCCPHGPSSRRRCQPAPPPLRPRRMLPQSSGGPRLPAGGEFPLYALLTMKGRDSRVRFGASIRVSAFNKFT
jgi:hypothetical protein